LTTGTQVRDDWCSPHSCFTSVECAAADCHCSLNFLQRVSSVAICQLGRGLSSRHQSAHLHNVSSNTVCQPCFQLVEPAARFQPRIVDLAANLSPRLQFVRAATFQAPFNSSLSSQAPFNYFNLAQLQTPSFAATCQSSCKVSSFNQVQSVITNSTQVLQLGSAGNIQLCSFAAML